MQRVEAAIAELFQAAVELGGTLSGEHGIGTTKTPFLGLALCREASTLMEGIKDVFDPLGIMNPGKIFGGSSPIKAN
jgi:glycolate oxidase